MSRPAWLVMLTIAATACSGGGDGDTSEGEGGSSSDSSDSSNSGDATSSSANDDSSDTSDSAGSTGDSSSGDSAADSADAQDGSTAGSGGETMSSGGDDSSEPEEMLDPDVDWEAFTLVYDKMYSAYVEGMTFQVPVYVQDIEVELADWSAIPSSAVSFDADPESGGVLVTVLEPVDEITIAARSGDLGGTAPLFITKGTMEQWEAGKARYANGVELNIELDPGQSLEDLANSIDPDYMPPEPPDDLACNNCHTTGAKYFEIQHTPTQAARFSDDDLRVILTEGRKPEGVGFRVLPDELFNMTDEELYAQFHTWEATEEEITGLIIYLRSLTPAGQGDILLPDGTYVEPGTDPSDL